jgi:hypothetical protein
MSTKGRLTDVEQTLEALGGAVRALEARVHKLEGTVAAKLAEPAQEPGQRSLTKPDKTAEPAPALNGIWANDQVSAGRDRALAQVVASITQLVEAVQQLQDIIEPDDPVALEAPPAMKQSAIKPAATRPAGTKPGADGPRARERRKLPEVRRADEEFEKAAAAELAEHEAWLQDLRQRLTGSPASEDKGSS